MALTRIENNQITNAVSGNTQVGINGNAKIQQFTITGAQLANSIVYGSDFTANGNITGGNLFTGGTISSTSTITGGNIATAGYVSATSNITGGNIFTAGQVSATGNVTGAYFLGNIACATGYNSNTIYNGTSNVLIATANGNITMGVDGVPNVVIVTSTGIQTNNFSTSGNAIIGGDLIVNGNTTYINITDLNVEDPIIGLGRGPNNTPLTTNDGKDRGEQLWYYAGSEKSAFTGFDNSAGKIIMATDVTIANEIVTVVNYGGFVAGDIESTTVSATGTVTGGNLATGGTVSSTGTVTGGNLATGGTVSATGTVTGGNIATAGTVSATGTITSADTITGGNLATGGTASAGGTITGGNLATGGTVSATGTVTGGNIATGGTVSSTGTVTGGNVATAGTVSATGTITSADTITGGNLATGGTVSSTGTVTGGNLATGGTVSATGTVTGGNIATGGTVSATGNITAGASSFFIGNGSQLTGVTASSVDANALTGNTLSSNVVFSSLTTVGTLVDLSVTGTATTGNLATAGTVSATGNITTGNLISNGQVTAVGNIQGANVRSLGVMFGNVCLLTPGFVSAGGNVIVGGLITAAGNITGGNIDTAGVVSAAGNITGGNVLTAGVVSATGNVIASNVITATVTTSSGDLKLEPVGNIVLGNRYINGLQLTPQQDADAASKYYVDQLVTTSISYHEAVVVATNTTLATATGGTVTYNQPNGAGNGQGATLTTTGSFNLIDTGNVQTAGTRILVKNEANATHNGVYVWSNATVITRASTEDTYGPANANTLSINDYFFVSGGNVNLGSAWIVDAPSGVITFGTSDIQFAQFSQSQIYSANTSAGLSLVGQTFSAKVDNNTTAFDLGGNIIVKAGANLTTPNIGAATGTSLSVTGDITGGNIATAGTVSATGTVTGGNIATGGTVSAAGNITGGNVLFGSGIVSGTGNVYASNFIGNITGNIDAAGSNTEIQFNNNGLLGASAGLTFNSTGNVLTANGNISGANFLTTGVVSATGNVSGNYFIGNGSQLTGIDATLISNGNSNVQVYANSNVAVTVAGTANVAVFTTSGMSVTGNVQSTQYTLGANAVFGSSLTAVTGATVAINATDSILMPVGNTLQRPTGVTGMLRFNTTSDKLEVYDSNSWEEVGATVFTVIGDDQFAGDGSTVTFTLSSSQTTDSCIVSINGVVQIPTTAYSVAGTTLTFTEAPQPGDDIDVRTITTTTTVTGISNSPGNAAVAVNDTTNIVYVTGQLSVSGGIIGNTGINTTQIINGSSDVNIASAGGNIVSTVAGNVVQTISAGLVAITGDLSVSGNATLSGNILGDRVQNGTTSIDIQTASGNANITVGGVSNVAVFTTTGVNIAGNLSATGNITGGNLIVSGNLIDTGNLSITTGSTGNTWTFDTAGNLVFPGGGLIRSTLNSGNTGVALFTSAANGEVSMNWANNNFVYVDNTGTFLQGTGGNVVQLTNDGRFLVGVTSSISLSANGNVTGANILTGGTVSATGNITGGNLSVGTGTVTVGNIVNSNGNGVGNIGSSTTYFNTVFAKATSAQYADLAEKYTADAEYAPGTVLVFGGSAEVTVDATDGDRRVAGVVSTNPSYIMNAGCAGTNVATVALTGRVPCLVTGSVRKGDLMVAAGLGRARAEADPKVGTVIGKALENHDGAEGTIEVVVGRF
jgi:fibronectin-binding autotransporter adhesin